MTYSATATATADGADRATLYRFLAPALLLLPMLACASAPDPNAPRICFTVDNSEGSGAVGNVWVRQQGSRDRGIRVGEVGLGRTVTECVRRTGLTGRWYFVAFSSTADRMDPALGQNSPPAHTSAAFIYEENVAYTWNVRTGVVTLGPLPPEN